ncbi:MAG TPA: tetratricopeptide repeat protein [Blastocatellia bacterium]|nr:tetratricopeptide repeat protein [Blastocatellia bacterium]
MSMLEAVVQRTQEQVDMLLELLQRQTASGLYDRAVLDAIVEQLSGRQPGAGDLDRLLPGSEKEAHSGPGEREQLPKRVQRMLREFSGENFDLFARLLETGSALFLDGKLQRGIRYFEKALLLDPANAALAFFIGEHFFRFNKPVLSRAYLERAVTSQSGNHTAMLMLGVICGDEGDLDQAKSHLRRALKIKKNSFTAHFGLGRILVSEGRLPEAITHLRRALVLKPTPEMHYLLGRAYLEDGRANIAVRHLRRCLQMDPRFDAALYHLGLIYLGQNRLVLAQEHFKAAYEINPRESRYRVALKARKAERLSPLPVGRATVSSRKVVTSGDVRLAELLRSDLLNPQANLAEARKGHRRG